MGGISRQRHVKADSPLAVATVGWANDGGFAYDLGDSTNDGTQLIKVTTFRGRDPSVALQTGVGQGQQLLCQIAQSVVSLPQHGDRVLIAMPEPNAMMPGNSVVVCTLGNTAWKLQGNLGAGDLVIPAPSGNARLVLTGAGGFAFITTAADGSSIAFTISPSDGCHLAGPWGSISFDNYGLRGNIGGGPSFKFTQIGGLPSPFDLIAGSVAQISAGTVKVDGLQVLLGPDSVNSVFVPTAAYNDGLSAPAPAAFLQEFLSAFGYYAAAVETIVTQLSANPQFTGVTPAALTAFFQAQSSLVDGVLSAGTILTTPCVKVAYPGPI